MSKASAAKIKISLDGDFYTPPAVMAIEPFTQVVRVPYVICAVFFTLHYVNTIGHIVPVSVFTPECIYVDDQALKRG